MPGMTMSPKPSIEKGIVLLPSSSALGNSNLIGASKDFACTTTGSQGAQHGKAQHSTAWHSTAQQATTPHHSNHDRRAEQQTGEYKENIQTTFAPCRDLHFVSKGGLLLLQHQHCSLMTA